MNEPWDFGYLLTSDRDDLLKELALTHAELATLHEEIAFNRAAEIENKALKGPRMMDEGHRDALIEKKLLLIRLLDAAD